MLLVEGARRPGAKILISGGSRCNVTNTVVADTDFWGGSRSIIRRVLRAFPVRETIAFFDELGIPLHEEADGKLFPNSNRSRDVLGALLREVERCGATLRADTRVGDVTRTSSGFRVASSRGGFRAPIVVLATGGRSLPKTGSDGAGYEFATRLGHSLTPTTPGLTPLLLDDTDTVQARLSGVAHDVELTLWIDSAVAERITGAMLWTHFGVSGPAALNMSRHWLRAQLEGRDARMTVSFVPRSTFESLDREWTRLAVERPKAAVQTALSSLVPASLGAAILGRLDLVADTPLAHFPRDARRRLVRALIESPVAVTGSRGYPFAEVTASGVTLSEIDAATMASRVCPGLFLVGEILDVDGRLGGFNFQWAWSSARVAANAIARRQLSTT